MIKTGLGIQDGGDFFAAGEKAAQEAADNLGSAPDLFLVAAPFTPRQEKMLAGIASVFPEVPLAGGTAGWGVITDKGIKEKETVVLALKFDRADFKIALAENLSKDAKAAGIDLGRSLSKGHKIPPHFLLIFSSGLGVAFDDFLKGLKSVLGSKTNVLGGGTGDSMALQNGGNQFFNNQLMSNAAVGVGFWGSAQSVVRAGHGWEPLGLEMKISKAQGIFVSEIDNRPAVEIFEKYFPRSEIRDPKFFSPQGQGILYPLGIMSVRAESFTIRQVVGVGPKGELIFATNMPQGAIVRIMQAQTSKMIDVAGNVGKGLSATLEGDGKVAFIFDCVVRRLLLSPDQQKEIDAFIHEMNKDIPIFGFFSYGEICSGKNEASWFVHNETFTAGLLKE